MPYLYQDPEEYLWLSTEVDRHETEQAMALGKLLFDTFHPRSVIDVGCSSGIYLLPFVENNIEIYGVDGFVGGGKWIPRFYELVDLRNPWTPFHWYDLCLNIEVAEHLQPWHSQTLVDTLCRCSPLIFFSAARPGQNGEGHYAERTQGEWEEMFAKNGFRRDHDTTNQILTVLNNDPVYDHCGWLRWNSMILRRQW